MHVTAIIAAGGSGQRFGGAAPKQLQSIGGRPILQRSVEVFVSHPSIDAVIVALPPSLAGDPPAYLRAAGKPVQIVAGGPRRQDSVANAFRAAADSTDLFVIHDAARPFASADLIARTIAAAAESGAALAAMQSRDTVKQGEDAAEGQDGRDERQEGTRRRGSAVRVVKTTLPRETIYLAQTPQAFRRDVLRRALELAARDGVDATDEAALVELAGLPVRLVDGEASNIKITTADDIPIAEAIAAAHDAPGTAQLAPRTLHPAPDEGSAYPARDGSAAAPLPSRTGRAGTGYDLHRLVAGRPLVLGGVTIPFERGALGHSDADVVCHALTDAILGAAGLGDIGRHFPDTDARWKDANSLALLRQVVALVRGAGFAIGNVDVTVVLEAPKISGHVDAIRASVAGALGIEVTRVSIKGKTNEGVDAVGRGEAIAAHAIALIRAIIPNS
jgi:2-C-methyl-D-erythritol 4-phosphate cytidylyltransferase / 2-C-methyl-D-erythritol 2,4-cyclodiphosphate synthase